MPICKNFLALSIPTKSSCCSYSLNTDHICSAETRAKSGVRKRQRGRRRSLYGDGVKMPRSVGVYLYVSQRAGPSVVGGDDGDMVCLSAINHQQCCCRWTIPMSIRGYNRGIANDVAGIKIRR